MKKNISICLNKKATEVKIKGQLKVLSSMPGGYNVLSGFFIIYCSNFYTINSLRFPSSQKSAKLHVHHMDLILPNYWNQPKRIKHLSHIILQRLIAHSNLENRWKFLICISKFNGLTALNLQIKTLRFILNWLAVLVESSNLTQTEQLCWTM